MTISMPIRLRLRNGAEGYSVEDGSGRVLAYFYFDDGNDPVRRSVRNRLTKAEALAAAKICAAALRSHYYQQIIPPQAGQAHDLP